MIRTKGSNTKVLIVLPEIPSFNAKTPTPINVKILFWTRKTNQAVKSVSIQPLVVNNNETHGWNLQNQPSKTIISNNEIDQTKTVLWLYMNAV